MRFGLLGDHPDGLNMARALVGSGRHELVAFTDVPRSFPSAAFAVPGWPLPKRVAELEEVLADPAVEAVIVAGRPDDRPAQLRRALQSERHVLCVHPPDQSPDIAYEAALIQADTRQVLLPLLTDPLHPAVGRLVELTRDADGPLGKLRLVELDWRETGVVLGEVDRLRLRAALPCWAVLWAIGGPIQEVSAFAEHEEIVPEEPLLVAGRFEHGGIFQTSLVPGQPERRWRLAVSGTAGRAELSFLHGPPGPARLTWQDRAGQACEEAWEAWDPWPIMVDVFESAAGLRPIGNHAALERPRSRLAERESTALTAVKPVATIGPDDPPFARLAPTWQDTIRFLELDDAARRSVERRRSNTLDYPDATEEVGFKGTMTLVGCALLWALLLLLIISAWAPWLRWFIIPVLVLFLALQFLRWVIPRAPVDQQPTSGRAEVPDSARDGPRVP